MINDGLWCAFDAVHMGAGTENYVGQVGGITREAQDELAAKSHERAAAAQKEGRFADEIAPVSITQRKGDPVVVDTDEGVRPGTTTESLAGLRPAFSKDGTITAGNASQISDGGAAVIVTSRAKAEELGVTPLAELIGYGMVAGPDASLLTQPSRAIKRALEANDMTASDVDLFELNEAFAAVGHRVDARPRHQATTSSTSTAARSRSVTRSACRARGSCSRSSTSCAGAVVASARRRCAVAAARATPRSSARCSAARAAASRRPALPSVGAWCRSYGRGESVRSSTPRSRCTGPASRKLVARRGDRRRPGPGAQRARAALGPARPLQAQRHRHGQPAVRRELRRGAASRRVVVVTVVGVLSTAFVVAVCTRIVGRRVHRPDVARPATRSRAVRPRVFAIVGTTLLVVVSEAHRLRRSASSARSSR